MSEFKGTKGKWVFEYDGISGSYDIYSTDDEFICDVTPMTEYHTVSDRILKEAKSNALLISKAPEMLEMLKVLVKVLKTINIFGATKRIIEKADKLIKEATQI